MNSKKFDFKNDFKDEREKSTAAFITQADEAREKKKANRSARLNLSMPPQLKEDVELIAAKQRKSANTIINELLEKFVEDNQEDLEASRAFFGKN